VKEFESPLTPVFLPGLRTDERNPRNAAGLTVCKNVMPVAKTLSYVEPFTSPITALEAVLDWPFPTFLPGPSGLYLGTRHNVYSVNLSTYALTPLVDWLDVSYGWSLADFHSFQIFHNGDVAVVKDVGAGDYHVDIGNYPCKTLLNFRGQLIMANTNGGENWLKWSKIGNVDLTLDNENEAGNGPLPIRGAIHRLMYLHSGADLSGRDRGSFVAYGENGIVISKTYSEPTTTFGYKESNETYGIPSFGCVGGDKDEHLFIDNRGFLHLLTIKGDQTLGYQEFMQPLIADSPVISFDNVERQWFISTENKCYLFSKEGLCEIDQIITSGWVQGTSFKVMGYVPATFTIEVTSDTFDFQQRMFKQLAVLNVGAHTDGKLYCMVQYKDPVTNLFVSTPLKPFSPGGVCFPQVAGRDFRIYLKCIDFTYFKLDEVVARWKLVDKTGIRGTYANAKASA